jgi:hypothetical protein
MLVRGKKSLSASRQRFSRQQYSQTEPDRAGEKSSVRSAFAGCLKAKEKVKAFQP